MKRTGKGVLLLSKIFDLIFPPRCAVCDHILPILPEGWCIRICPGCRKELRFIKEPFCMKCGKPLESDSTEYCDDCGRKKHLFSSGRSVFLYHGKLKDSLYRFKYGKRREYAVFYAEAAYAKRSGWIKNINPDLIVPVPLHPSKQRRRGYNQAEDFARELSRLSGIPMDPHLVRRIRKTVPMKGLSEAERRQNVKHAFSVVPGLYSNGKRPLRILITDDIYTTGSTVDAICGAIREEYSAEIFFLSISIGKSL